MSFLLDTDICSAYVNGNQRIWSRFIQHGGGLHVSTVSVGELYTWAKRANAPASRLTKVEEMLSRVTVLTVTLDVGVTFGIVRAALFDLGTPLPELDLFNASVALVHNLTVVTHNTKDYREILTLNVVDWLIP